MGGWVSPNLKIVQIGKNVRKNEPPLKRLSHWSEYPECDSEFLTVVWVDSLYPHGAVELAHHADTMNPPRSKFNGRIQSGQPTSCGYNESTYTIFDSFATHTLYKVTA